MTGTAAAVAAAEPPAGEADAGFFEEGGQKTAFPVVGKGQGEARNRRPAQPVDVPVEPFRPPQMAQAAGADAARTAGAAAVGVEPGRQGWPPQARWCRHRPPRPEEENIGSAGGTRPQPVLGIAGAGCQMPRRRHCSIARSRGSSKPISTR